MKQHILLHLINPNTLFEMDTNEGLLTISAEEIDDMEHRYRATFINSLTGFKSVNLVGTVNTLQQTNLAIFNSIVHVGANPALIGFIVRPTIAERHTLNNILETGFYTINHISEAIFKQAHQTSARYPEAVSEFDAVNLEAEYINGFAAPFVKEASVKFGVAFRQKVPFEINGTSFIIGQIQQVHLPRHILQADGFLQLEQAGTLTCSGLDSYHVTHQLSRLPYAKV